MIIDQLTAIASPQGTDELPIERGQLTYKITWDDLAGEDISALKTDMQNVQSDIGDINTALDGKQDTLVSGTNIKTINGNSILGIGDLEIKGGGGLWFTNVAVSATTGDIVTITDSNITADYVLGRIEWANPSAITTDVTWTTSAGSLVLNGTASSATTANILLVLKNN